VNAAEVREALERHWKPSEYLVMHECGQDAMRMGRKIDTLVMSLWRSRGYELDAIEIKVSLSDWMREVNNPEKADWWWTHSHRFHVAVPVKIAPKVRETLPSGWGLLAVDDGKVAQIVKPERHVADALPWPAIVGIMRGASGAGANALVREFGKGRVLGFKEGREQTERELGPSADRERLEALRAKVAAFEEASGISISGAHRVEGVRRLGDLVAIVRTWEHEPEYAATRLASTAKQLHEAGDGIAAIAAQLLPTVPAG